MERFRPEEATPEERRRFGFLEGSPELFETKLLSVTPSGGPEQQTPSTPELLVLGRDPGGMVSLIPVLEELAKTGCCMRALVDGRAEQNLRARFSVVDETPAESPLLASDAFGTPNAILAAISVSGGIEQFASSTYPEVPLVMIEDFYRATFEYLRWARDHGVAYPAALCVLDEMAKKLLVREFPAIADRITVTGSPAFDRLATEPTEEIAVRVRERLQIPSGVPFVSFMSALQDAEEIPLLAEALDALERPLAISVRKHPRDNTPIADYERAFRRGELLVPETASLTTDEVGAASDLVITSWSTEGLKAIYRRKPSIHYIDASLPNIPANLEVPVPQEGLGASLGATHKEQLPALISQALDPESALRRDLDASMLRWYPVDGKNAQRVSAIVKRFI